MNNEENYAHTHCTVLNNSEDGIVVELAIRSRYHEELIMEVLREAEDKIKGLFREMKYGHPKHSQ